MHERDGVTTVIRRVLYVLVSLLLFCGFFACSPKPETPQIAIVYAVGGKGDFSYNDAAYQGVKRIRAELQVPITEVEPGQLSEYEPTLRKLSQANYKLIIAVGFLFEDPIRRVAPDFPTTRYAIIDGAIYDLPNVVSLQFNVREGSFLVGVIAGLMTKSGRIGFIGGTDIPIINEFREGYIAGARHAKGDIEVLTAYLGVGPSAFTDPAKGKEVALTMYARGVDIIYHAAGASGNGVIEAAREKRRYAIGVDINQNYLAPGAVLTSMLKRLDLAIYDTVSNFLRGQFSPGKRVYGLKEGGVGYAIDEHNDALLPQEVRARVAELKERIVRGELSVSPPSR